MLSANAFMSGMEMLKKCFIGWQFDTNDEMQVKLWFSAFKNTTDDQFISIVLTADIYRHAYEERGYESRLLSRTCEDAATVTSVLIPWNTCGMTQSTVLGVPTLTYLPYCFFNYLSPLMTLLIAAVGWKIKQHKS